MSVRTIFSAWESNDAKASKPRIPLREARKQQTSRSRIQGISHKPVWARNEREDTRCRYSFQHHDDTRCYMEEYRKANAFSTVALSRSDGSMQTEIRKLYDALRNGSVPKHCLCRQMLSYLLCMPSATVQL